MVVVGKGNEFDIFSKSEIHRVKLAWSWSIVVRRYDDFNSVLGLRDGVRVRLGVWFRLRLRVRVAV